MAKISVLFLLFALFAFCGADEVKKGENPLESPDIAVQNWINNAQKFLEENKDKLSEIVKTISDRAKETMDRVKEEYNKNNAELTNNKQA